MHLADRIEVGRHFSVVRLADERGQVTSQMRFAKTDHLVIQGRFVRRLRHNTFVTGLPRYKVPPSGVISVEFFGLPATVLKPVVSKAKHLQSAIMTRAQWRQLKVA